MNCPGTADGAARWLFAAAVLIALLLRLPGIDYGLPQQLKADEFDLPAAALKLLQTRSPVFGPSLLYPPAPVYIYAALIPPYLGGAWLVQVVDKEADRVLTEEDRSALIDKAYSDWVAGLWQAASADVITDLTEDSQKWVIDRAYKELRKNTGQ